jgi:hypothetical protein
MQCAVHADLEDAFDASPTVVGKDGRRYRDVAVSGSLPAVRHVYSDRRLPQFDFCLSFGETELTARLRWKTPVSVSASSSCRITLIRRKQNHDFAYGNASVTHLSE